MTERKAKPKTKGQVVRCAINKVWLGDGKTMSLGDEVLITDDLAKILIKNKQAVKVDG